MNQLLQAAEQAAMNKVDQRLRPAVQHVVDAGKQMMYGDQTRHMFFRAVKQAKPDLIGKSFAGMVVLIYKHSDEKIPMQILIPAGTIILCEGLQFMEDSGFVKIDADYLATATKSMGEMLLQLFHATPDKLQKIQDQSAQPPGIVGGAMQPQGAPSPAPQPGAM